MDKINIYWAQSAMTLFVYLQIIGYKFVNFAQELETIFKKTAF